MGDGSIPFSGDDDNDDDVDIGNAGIAVGAGGYDDEDDGEDDGDGENGLMRGATTSGSCSGGGAGSDGDTAANGSGCAGRSGGGIASGIGVRLVGMTTTRVAKGLTGAGRGSAIGPSTSRSIVRSGSMTTTSARALIEAWPISSMTTSTTSRGSSFR